MHVEIQIKDINSLSLTEVTEILSRLSNKNDEDAESSIQPELRKRYVNATPGPHAQMALALVWQNGFLVTWVGTRPWPEKFKGDPVTAQTVECFTDPQYRRHGFAHLGLQALISAGVIDREKIVSVYAPEVVKLAESCGCKVVILCEVQR